MSTPAQQNISPEQQKLAQEAMRKMFGGLPPVNPVIRRITTPDPEPVKEEIPKTPYLLEPGEVCEGDFWETIRRSTEEKNDFIDFMPAGNTLGYVVTATPDGNVHMRGGVPVHAAFPVMPWKQFSGSLGEVLKVCRTTWGETWGK